MGSGKSTVGRLVAARTGASHRDLDQLVENAMRMTIPEIFERMGEAEFRAAEARELAAALEPGVVLSLGGGAVMDGRSWALVRERALTVYLECPFEVLWARAAGSSRPLLAGRDRDQVRALLDTRLPRYREAAHTVDATRPPDHVAEEVAALWNG